MRAWPALLAAAALTFAWIASSCKGASTAGSGEADLDGDPLVLVPESAVVVARFDARAIFDNGAIGAPLAALAARFVPLGDDAGFQAARDVDKLLVLSFATGGVDAAAVLGGRFDVARISAATKTAGGAAIVRGVYAGQPTYTVGASSGSVTYAVLSPKTVVAGTGDGLRRVLERVQAGGLKRTIAPWVAQTIETPGAEVAIAGDFASQPIASAAIGAVKIPWLDGLRVARVIGNFEAPGMNVAATLTYGDAQQTQAAADGVRSVDGWLNVLGPLLGGIRLQNLAVTTQDANLECKFAVDDQALRAALAYAPRLLPNPQ
jgi:hypothetical protein